MADEPRITEAATKKRGRPRKYKADPYDGCHGRTGRNWQNYVNASTLIELLYELADNDETVTNELDSEYVELAECFIWRHANDDDDKPHYRHQGVAEQIGRMYNAGRIDAQEAAGLARLALRRIKEDGYTSRAVEKELRAYHKSLRISEAATENREA